MVAGQHCALTAGQALESQSTAPDRVQVSMSPLQYPSCKSPAHSKRPTSCLPLACVKKLEPLLMSIKHAMHPMTADGSCSQMHCSP